MDGSRLRFPLSALGMSPSGLFRLLARWWRGDPFHLRRGSFDAGLPPLRHEFFGRFEVLGRLLAPAFRLAARSRFQALESDQGISTSATPVA